MPKKMTMLDAARSMTKLELRHAEEVQCSVCSYLVGRTPEEVAELTGMPKTLVKKLGTEDIGACWDYILWKRRQQ